MRAVPVGICVYSWLLLLTGEIQRTPEIEFFDPIGECWIICRVDDALILEKVEKAPLRDHFGDFGIVSQSHNFWMFAQLARTRKGEEFLRAFLIRKYTPDFAERFIRLQRNGVCLLDRVSEKPKLERIL